MQIFKLRTLSEESDGTSGKGELFSGNSGNLLQNK